MRSRPTGKDLLLGGGHLAAVWSLAFVQPLLDLLGRTPEFFIARGNGPGDILILAIGFTLVPPLLLLAVEAVVARMLPRAYRPLHLSLMAVISAFLFIEIISRVIDGPTLLILVLAVVAGGLLTWAVLRLEFFRNLLSFLILAPVVILALFLFTSPATKVIFPGGGEALAKHSGGNGRPVVLVIFDELGTSDLMTRDGAIDRQRFPGFARFARQATWYINQSTVDFFTPRAVPAILTGKQPPDNALPTARDQPSNIFTLLGAGRTVHAMEPVTSLCPVKMCPASDSEESRSARLRSLVSDLKYVEGRLVLPPGLAAKLPDVSSTFQDFGLDGRGHSGERTDRFFLKHLGTGPDAEGYRAFINEIPAARESLTVMHLILPHQPWRFTPNGTEYNRSPIDSLWNPADDQWQVADGGIASAQARMYTQTGFADFLLNRIERTLRRKGIWDEAIVVVAADHGTSFQGEGVARRRVDPRAMGEVANPPLLIKYPGQRKGVISPEHSITLDILPTIMKAVKAKSEHGFEGYPLQGRVPSRPVTVKDVLNGDRETSVPVSRMVAQREAAIERSRRRLGSGPLFTLGPTPDLLGRRVPPVPAGTTKATLDDPDLWQEVRPGEEPIPINVTGLLDADLDSAIVAIAVNGRVRATARSFELRGKIHFGALVDPAALRPGGNEIGIYLAEDGRLTPLGGNVG